MLGLTHQDQSVAQIAASLARTYVRNVLVKLGAHSRLQLAALAARDSLLAERRRTSPSAGGTDHPYLA
ncbi:MAG: hypothetical protein WBQ71_12075 [Trebonia sp.]